MANLATELISIDHANFTQCQNKKCHFAHEGDGCNRVIPYCKLKQNKQGGSGETKSKAKHDSEDTKENGKDDDALCESDFPAVPDNDFPTVPNDDFPTVLDGGFPVLDGKALDAWLSKMQQRGLDGEDLVSDESGSDEA